MKTMRQLLSAEQLAAADQAWEARFRRTDRVVFDEARFRPMVDAYYAAIGLEPPAEIAFYHSPMGAAVALDLEQETGVRPDADGVAPIMQTWSDQYPRYQEALRYLNDVVFTPSDAAFCAYYEALRAAGHEAEISPEAAKMEPLANELGYLIVYSDLAVIIDRPSEIHLDEQGRFHALDRPALCFADGWTRAFVHAVNMPREAVTAGIRETWLTPQRILECQNATERRNLLEIYGHDKFIQDLGAQPIDQSDFGTLYRVEFGLTAEQVAEIRARQDGNREDEPPEIPEGADEPLVMVRLVNSTPEYHTYEQVAPAAWVDPEGRRHPALPEGWPGDVAPPAGWSYAPPVTRGIGEPFHRIYWLRVPPTITRARDAVAWSFGLEPAAYAPAQES